MSDDIIRMAREAGLPFGQQGAIPLWDKELARFAALVRADCPAGGGSMTNITLPRAVVEQALEALKNFERFRQMMSDGPDASDKLLAEDYAEMAFVQGFQSITKLEVALARQAEPKPMLLEQRQRWEELAAMPQQAEPVADPFNCPKCGRHDYGLHGACPTCDAQQAEPVAGNTLLKAFLAAAKEAGVTHLRQVEAALYPVLEQQAEPKPMHPELRKMWEDHFDKCFRAMPVPEQAEPDTCTWQQDGDSDSGVYGTSCGHYFMLDDGTPEDNRLAWCCYCGKKLTQELITENKDD